MRSFLSIDWGGTALKGFFYSSINNSVLHFKFISMNLKVASDSDIKRSLYEVSQVVIDAHENPNDVIWAIGAAGAATNKANERLNRLSEYGEIHLFPDYICNCKSALGKSDGCISINGTGSILYAKSNNKFERFGGWGYLFDNEPSASYFGKLAVEGALLGLEGIENKVFSSFIEDVTNQSNINGNELSALTRANLLQSIYEQKNMQKYFASFSKSITRAFDNKNEWATKTVEASIDMLIDQIEDASLLFNGKQMKLCGIGGLWLGWDSFYSLVERGLKARNLPVCLTSPLFASEWGSVLHLYENDTINHNKLIEIINFSK